MISSLMLILINSLSLDYREKRCFLQFNQLRIKDNLKLKSALYIRYTVWRLWINYKQKIKIPKSRK
jgi:hypothetical protein